MTFSLELFRDSMHTISVALQLPITIILLLFLAITVLELGSLLGEIFMERRWLKVKIPELLNALQGKDSGGVIEEINNSGLLRRQKTALNELTAHGHLPSATLQALARRLLSSEELYYAKKTALTDLIARLGPMCGLMATLIPLGPGLIALGQGDTKTLAESLLTAFDATVTGLVSASVCYAISRLRKRWYEDYLVSLETLMESLLEEAGGHEPRIETKQAQTI